MSCAHSYEHMHNPRSYVLKCILTFLCKDLSVKKETNQNRIDITYQFFIGYNDHLLSFDIIFWMTSLKS